MALREYLARQVDFTTQDCVIPAALNQGFDTLQPDSDIGLVIWSELAPDTTTYPAIKKFLWVATNSSGVWTGAVYLWKETDWELLNLANGQLILPGTIDISSLSTSGALPSDIIQVNAIGDGYQFVNPVDAIPANSLDLTKLVASTANNGQIPLVVSGVWTYAALDTSLIIGLINNNTLPITKLVPSTTGKQILRTKADASTVEWVAFLDNFEDNSVPVGKLAGGASNVGKIPTVGTDGLISLQLPTTTRTQVQTSTSIPIPAVAAAPAVFAHGFAAMPTTYDAYFQCITANNGYTVGQRIHSYEVTTGGSNEEVPAFIFTADQTNITFVQRNTASSQRNFANILTGAGVTFDPSQWVLVLQATLTT